jgi:hypothetical protein
MHARPARRAQPGQQRRHAAPPRQPRGGQPAARHAGGVGLGATRHRCSTAAPPTTRRAAPAHWGLQPDHDAHVRGSSQRKHLLAGDSVGYGSAFVADQAMRIGIVACGHADGYPRRAPPAARRCWCDGVRTRTPWGVSAWTCWRWTSMPLGGSQPSGFGSPVTLWVRADNGQVLDTPPRWPTTPAHWATS